MIKVKISKKSIEVSGHAKYAAHGKDIVCAAVSSITITTVNAILKFDENAINYKEDNGYLKIDILKNNKATKLLLENMIELLEELEKQYEKNIKISREV
ncbi:MAG: ribosomal-processing cysteine protease Prp [Bacilli bacterium]|nr:ribosomal-processing cysteine protease Prp [Bacilli bacterium]